MHNINQSIQPFIRMLLRLGDDRYHFIDMLLLARDVCNLRSERLNGSIGLRL